MKETILIPAPKRLLSTTGKDVSKLEEYIRLKTREPAIEGVLNFLKGVRKAQEVEILFIKAEWGEGKTSIYEGLLKREDIMQRDIAAKVETITLLSWLEKIREGKLFDDTENKGIQLFGAILLALSDHLGDVEILKGVAHRIKNLMKKYERFTEMFIQEALRAIFASLPKESRLIIFIDEFEDIIDRADLQDDVIIGLVQIKNGSPTIISTDGEFAGRVHFIIAVTPAAYVAIASRHGAQIGRLLRRKDVVELCRVNRLDAYNFILGALDYCFNGKPSRLPLSSAGLMNTIWLASMGNLGAMAQIINRLLSGAMRAAEEGLMKVIDHADFVKYLRGYEIGVYGGELEVLSSELMIKVDKAVEESPAVYRKEELRDLAYRLIADTAPIPLPTIYRKYGDDIYSGTLDILSKALGLDRNALLLHFRRIKMDGERFREIVRNIIESYCEELSTETVKSLTEKLLDALRFPTYEEGCLQERFFIFYEKLTRLRDDPLTKHEYEQAVEYLMMFCPELGDGVGRLDIILSQIYEKVRNALSDEIYVMLSPMAFNMLFPSPTLMFLDFIEDAAERLKVWLETRQKLGEFEEEFRLGIIELLETSSGFRVERLGRDRYLLSITDPTGREIKLRVLILTMLNPTSVSKRELEEKIEEDANVPLILVFHWGDLGDIRGVLDLAMIAEEDTYVRDYLIFPLIMVWAQQVVGYVLAKKIGLRIRSERWKEKASRLLKQIAFERMLMNWLKKADKRGFVLTVRALKHVRLADLSKAIRPFIYFCSSDGTATISDIFRASMDVDKKFRIFGKSFGVNPLDVTSEDALRNHAADLNAFGLLEYDLAQDRVRLIDSPVERRIRVIIRHGLAYNEETLKAFFVDYGGDIRPYLEVMDEKGLVKLRKRRNIVESITMPDLHQAGEYIDRLREKLSNLERRSDILRYGLFITKKERDCRVIDIKECLTHIRQLLKELDDLHEQVQLGKDVSLIFRARMKLTNTLINYVEGLMKDTDEDKKEAIKCFNKVRDEFKVCRNAIRKNIRESLNELLNQLGLVQAQVKELKEEVELQSQFETVKSLLDKEIPEDKLSELKHQLERGELYIERRSELDIKRQAIVRYFKKTLTVNARAYLMIGACENLLRFIEKLREQIRDLGSRINETNVLLRDVRQHPLFTVDLKEELKLTRLICEWARTVMDPKALIPQLEGVVVEHITKMSDIESLLGMIFQSLSYAKDRLEGLYNFVMDTKKVEEEFTRKFKDIKCKIEILANFLSNSSMSTQLEESINILKETIERYENVLLSRAKQTLERYDEQVVRLAKEITEKICRELVNLIKKLESVSENLHGITREITYRFRAELRRIEQLLKVLERCVKRFPDHARIDEQTLEELRSKHDDLDRLIQDLSSDFFRTAAETDYNSIRKDLMEIRNELIKLCKYFLSDRELMVYEAVCRLVVQGTRDFLQLVKKMTSSEGGLEREEVIRCLISLNSKGIIRLEVGL